MTLAQRIHEARISKGLTLEQLGKMIGLGKSAINKYEKGIVTNIPPDRIEALAAALDVTPGYLMGWVDHPRQMNLWEAAGASMNEQMAVYSEMGEDQKAAGSSPATSTKKARKIGLFSCFKFLSMVSNVSLLPTWLPTKTPTRLPTKSEVSNLAFLENV